MAEDPKEQAVATKLDEAAARFAGVGDDLKTARNALHDAIVEALRAGWGPAKIARHVPYDRQHIDRIRRNADLPPTRAATVQRIPKEE